MNTYETNGAINVPQQESDFNPVKTALWGLAGWHLAGALIAMFAADRSTRSGRIQYRVALTIVWIGVIWVAVFIYWMIYFMITSPDIAIT